MSIFISSRYSDLQTLSSTEYAHLLRCTDEERSEQVLVRVFRTSREAEQSYILTEIASLQKIAAPQLARVYDMGLSSMNEPYMVFEQIPHIPIENIPAAQFHNPAFLTDLAVSALQALAPLHAKYRTLACLTPQSLRLADIENPTAHIALETWEPPYNAGVMRSFYGAHNSYAAPELAAGAVLDGRADLYSLGVVLYEAVTGLSFSDLSMVDAPGMVAHLVVKNLRDHAPAFPDALAQWLYGLVERDRSMRFFSAREALDYLRAHSSASGASLQHSTSADSSLPEQIELAPTPVHLSPVNAIGLESAFAAVVNVQSPFAESPVLEISGEPGVGKTFLLSTLLQSRLKSTALLRQNIEYIRPVDASTLADKISAALEHHQPTLFLVDDAEQIPDSVRTEAKQALAREEAALIGVRVVATHRSQLPLLAAKPTSVTLSHLAPSHVPLFCTEILGRCAFAPEFMKYLYNLTKGHPLFLETLLRYLVQMNVITRRNRIWTHADVPQTQSNGETIHNLHYYVTNAMRALPEERANVLAALLALSKAGVQSVSLHTLAELLDTSTQATMRHILPLSFEGFVKIRASYLEFAHDVMLEAALATCSETSVQTYLHKWKSAYHSNKQHEQFAGPIHKSLEEQSTHNIPTQQFAEQHTASPENNGSTQLHSAKNRPLDSQDSSQILSSQDFGGSNNIVGNNNGATNDVQQAVILYGASKQAQTLRRNVEIAAAHHLLPCLIEGTFGTQKEELALFIHSASERRHAPFYEVSCSDFDAEELEKYLFGNERSQGLIASTAGGTLFLDEMDTVAPHLQVRLGRLMQSSQKQRVRTSSSAIAPTLPSAQHDASASIRTDARIIIGFTLQGGVRADDALRTGSLQPELFFAVSSVRVSAPLLAERREDIPLMARVFAERISREYAIPPRFESLPERFWQSLAEKEWLGDITELEALIRRMVLSLGAMPANTQHGRDNAMIHEIMEELLAGQSHASTISGARIISSADKFSQEAQRASAELMGVEQASSYPSADGLLSIDDAQKEHILRALERTGGNKTKAAELLKIKRTTLLARMKKFGLMP